MPRCCVVIPTYREALHLTSLLPEVFAQQAQIPSHELWVVVVNDDAPDGSNAVLDGLQAAHPRLQVLHGPKQGLGVAYARGFAHAMATLAPNLLVQMDGDWQHDPRMLPILVRHCAPPVAAVIGSRFAPGGSTPTFSRRRRLTSRIGNGLIHRVAGLPHLHDYTSGFRCLATGTLANALAALEQDRLAARGYAFQSSLIAELLLGGAGVVEIPIAFGERRHGHSKLGVRDYAEFMRNLGKLRARCRRA